MASDSCKPGQYPPFRRVVTGHDDDGNAIIVSDENLIAYNPLTPTSDPAVKDSTIGFTSIWKLALTEFPINANADWCDFNGKPVPLGNKEGLMVRAVDFPPGPSLMHRTETFDFGLVLNDEIEMELDNGIKTTLRQHEMAVQRGTIHAWNNHGSKAVRMLFFLIASEKLKFGDKVLEASPLPPGLTGEGGDVCATDDTKQ